MCQGCPRPPLTACALLAVVRVRCGARLAGWAADHLEGLGVEVPKVARAKPAKAAIDALGECLRGGGGASSVGRGLWLWASGEDQLLEEEAQGPEAEGVHVVGGGVVTTISRGGEAATAVASRRAWKVSRTSSRSRYHRRRRSDWRKGWGWGGPSPSGFPWRLVWWRRGGPLLWRRYWKIA